MVYLLRVVRYILGLKYLYKNEKLLFVVVTFFSGFELQNISIPSAIFLKNKN